MDDYLFWVLFSVLLCYTAIDRFNLSKLAKSLVVLPALSLMAIAMALSVEQFDIEVYRRIYQRLSSPPDAWAIDLFPEYGYQQLNYFFNAGLGLNFEQFRFFYALIALYILYFSVSRVTSNQALYYFLYYPKFFLIGLISHSRSGLVNPFMFYVIDMTSRGKYFKVFLLSSVLSQFHLSAIFFNLVPLLRFVRLNLLLVALVIPAALAFHYLISPLIAGFFSLLDLRQASYFEAVDRSRGVIGVEFFRRAILVAFAAYIVYSNKSRGQRDDLIVKVFLLSVFVYIGFFDMKFVSDRVGGMLGFVEPLLLIIFFETHLRSMNKIVTYSIVFSYALSDFLVRALLLDSLPKHIGLDVLLATM